MEPTQNTNEVIGEKIEDLASELVMADLTDLPALAQMHSVFESIKKDALADNRPMLSAQAEASAKLLASIILSDVPDKDQAWDTLGKQVSDMQQLLHRGETQAEVTTQQPSSEALTTGFTLPSHIDEAIFSEFVTRQLAMLEDEVEGMILALEQENREEATKELKRYIHTLKGESALMGMVDVETICHTTEDILLERDPLELVDGLFALRDWLLKTIRAHAGKGELPGDGAEILELIKGSKSTPPARQESASEPTPASSAEEAPSSPSQQPSPSDLEPVYLEGDKSLISEFITESREHLESADIHLLELETEPSNIEALNAVFRAFHTIKGVAGFLALEDIRSLSHEAETLLDMARKGTITLADSAMDIVFDSVDMLKKLVEHIHNALTTGGAVAREADLHLLLTALRDVAAGRAPTTSIRGSQAGRKLGEILVNEGKVTPQVLEKAMERQSTLEPPPRKLGEVLVQENLVPAKEVAQALRSQTTTPLPPAPKTPPAAAAPAAAPRAAQAQQAVDVKETVKVDADRLDRLVEMIGELVIAESMVSQSEEIKSINATQFSRHLSQLDKITRELQEMGTSLRMVPLRSTFQKMARLVRDVARKANKQVEFIMAGEDTELDKTVVDKIGDPLVHMIRNSVDHGLEPTSEARTQTGKTPVGRIELRAYHKGGNIYIEIADDGRGLNREAILNKATERGLIKEGEIISDREIYQMIFQPGFSTAQKITDVSGRGVGMDVVRRNIDALRGQIEIQTEQNVGTTFSIRLPLTLAIIDGMVLRVGAERFIVPTLSIVRSIRPNPENLSTMLNANEMMMVQGQLIPIFRLNHLFSIEDAVEELTEGIAIIVEDDGRQAAILVDELLGQQQIVIKPLGEVLQGTQGLSGAAVMPDGRVGLILDVNGLLKIAGDMITQQ